MEHLATVDQTLSSKIIIENQYAVYKLYKYNISQKYS